MLGDNYACTDWERSLGSVGSSRPRLAAEQFLLFFHYFFISFIIVFYFIIILLLFFILNSATVQCSKP